MISFFFFLDLISLPSHSVCLLVFVWLVIAHNITLLALNQYFWKCNPYHHKSLCNPTSSLHKINITFSTRLKTTKNYNKGHFKNSLQKKTSSVTITTFVFLFKMFRAYLHDPGIRPVYDWAVCFWVNFRVVRNCALYNLDHLVKSDLQEVDTTRLYDLCF